MIGLRQISQLRTGSKIVRVENDVVVFEVNNYSLDKTFANMEIHGSLYPYYDPNGAILKPRGYYQSPTDAFDFRFMLFGEYDEDGITAYMSIGLEINEGMTDKEILHEVPENYYLVVK